MIVWPECGHTFSENDPRLEQDHCPDCQDHFASFLNRMLKS